MIGFSPFLLYNSVQNSCYQTIAAATITEFAILLCSVNAGATLGISNEACAALTPLVSMTRVYRFCPSKTYLTGNIEGDQSSPFGFSATGGLDFQFLVIPPNVKIVCDGCVFVGADESQVSTG